MDNRKYSIFLIFFLIQFSISLYSSVIREYRVDNDNVSLSAYYQFDANQKIIIIKCLLENKSEESIFLRKDISSDWDTAIDIDSLKFFKYGSSSYIGSVIWPNAMTRLYELHSGQKKKFRITIYFKRKGEFYEEQMAQKCPIILEYFRYDEKIATVLNKNKGKQFALEEDGLFSMIHFLLIQNKRRLNITLDFKGRIRY